MKTARYILIALACAAARPAAAQESGRPEVWGYVNNMVSGITENVTDSWYWQDIVHNRLNFFWQAGDYWSVDASMRNRLFFGDFIKYSLYGEGLESDHGIVDLSWNICDGSDAVFNVTFDRLALAFEKGKWNLKLGRQRVNWGQTFVWNPNDLFNSYSFFDFDYVERPGCDAFRATCYHTATSFSELVVSADHAYDITAALLHHGVIRAFDYQVIAGIQGSDDFVVGGAWTGDIRGYNLRGEFAYRQPLERFFRDGGVFEIAVGVDHLFSIGEKSLMAQCEAMWNNKPGVFDIDNLLGLVADFNSTASSSVMTVMNDWNCVATLSYPATERFSISAAGMYMGGVKAAYAGLTTSYSFGDNWEFSLISQYFTDTRDDLPLDVSATFGFARLKFSF